MMARHHFQQGELAQWLERIASGDETAPPVPEQAAEALILLRCAQRTANGTLQITEKGKLALRMEAGRLS